VTLNGNTLMVTPTHVGVGQERVEQALKKMRRRYGAMLKRLAD
jgi:hypothetical protein